MNLNLSGDYSVIDNVATVTLFRRLTGGTFDQGTSLTAAFSVSSKADVEATSKGLLSRVHRRWSLWQAQTGAVAPKVNDVLQEASGVRWTVWSVEVHMPTARYVLDTVQDR